MNETTNPDTGAVIGYYELIADIDVSSWSDEDRAFAPIGGGGGKGFSGHFDGNGFAITGVLIDTDAEAGVSAGLFGTINANGVVKTLK